MKRVCAISGVLVLAAAPAWAQWVTFDNETSTRLDLSTVSMNDDEEKDMGVGDLNKDGWDDVIVVRKVPFTVQGARQDVLLMNENGVLVERTAEFAPGFLAEITDARDIVVMDFDGDTWLDVVIARTFFEQPSFYRNLGLNAKGKWLGLVDESEDRFPHMIPPNMAGPKFCGVTAGDVTGDGSPDIYFSNYKNEGGGSEDVLLINDGNGFFTNETAARLGDRANVAFGSGAMIIDVNNDGHNDIIKLSTLYSVLPWDAKAQVILYNDGTGDFTVLDYQMMNVNEPYMFIPVHLNGDNMLDVYGVQDPQDRIHLATSIVNGRVSYATSSPSPSPRTDGFGGSLGAVDLDHDGDMDIGVAPIDVDIANCGVFAEFTLLRNDGNGGLSDPWPSNQDQDFHIDAHDYAFIDIDRDGSHDMFMGLCTGWRIFIQTNVPPAEVAPVVDVASSHGQIVSGGVPELSASDDTYLRANSFFGFSAAEANLLRIEIGTETTLADPLSADVTLEARINNPGGTAKLSIRNFKTRLYDLLDTYTINQTEAFKVIKGVNLEDHVRPGDGRIEIRFQSSVIATFAASGFEASVDFFEMRAFSVD